jgi:hypothetical protein
MDFRSPTVRARGNLPARIHFQIVGKVTPTRSSICFLLSSRPCGRILSTSSAVGGGGGGVQTLPGNVVVFGASLTPLSALRERSEISGNGIGHPFFRTRRLSPKIKIGQPAHCCASVTFILPLNRLCRSWTKLPYVIGPSGLSPKGLRNADTPAPPEGSNWGQERQPRELTAPLTHRATTFCYQTAPAPHCRRPAGRWPARRYGRRPLP